MTTAANRRLSLTAAARTIFRTKSPSDRQVYRVFQLMKTGALPARRDGAPEKWSTTESALADFLAQAQVERLHQHSSLESDEPNFLGETYRDIWRDYFLAIMLRRRATHRSRVFQRMVTVGQVVVILVGLGAILAIGQQVGHMAAMPAERQSVMQWIDTQTDDFAIEKWEPTQSTGPANGLLVEVNYRYRKDSPRWIHTNRQFIVEGDQVSEVADVD